LSGVTETLDKLKRDPALEYGLRALAEQAMRYLRSLTPGSGTMRHSWHQHFETGGDGFLKSITIDNSYEPKEVVGYMEWGTPAHGIDPKPENPIQRLVFFWPLLGKLIFAKHVEHRGTKPYLMVGHTMDLLQLQQAAWMRVFEDKIQIVASRL
jgi:hypothetical protein